jgi:hypothetical protein
LVLVIVSRGDAVSRSEAVLSRRQKFANGVSLAILKLLAVSRLPRKGGSVSRFKNESVGASGRRGVANSTLYHQDGDVPGWLLELLVVLGND